jgi:hypothetical protein
VRLVRLLTPVALFVVGVLLALYGVFALTFDETGGPRYVTLAGHHLDAHRVGWVSLVIGLTVIAVAVVLLRHGRRGS